MIFFLESQRFLIFFIALDWLSDLYFESFLVALFNSDLNFNCSSSASFKNLSQPLIFLKKPNGPLNLIKFIGEIPGPLK